MCLPVLALAGVTGAYSRSYQYNPIGNLTHKAGVALTYPASGPASARPHAVTSTSGGGSLSYDANGNMTSRREATGQPTYSQVFDAENRVSQVSGNGQTTTFTYDGDGARVKKVDASGTTVYVGNHYEVFTPGAPPTPTPTPTPGVYTWQFTGQVQSPFGGPGVAGATVRLYRLSGSSWVQQAYQVTGSSGSFSLSYTSSSSSAQSFRLVKSNPKGCEPISATSPQLTVISANELRGANLAPGVYGSNVFIVWCEISWEVGRAPATSPGRAAGLAAPLAQTSTVTKYYYFGGKRVAMRQGSTLYFLHGDHLGSTSLLTNSSGQKVTNSDTWYYPYGEMRSSSSNPLTDYRFTGQRFESMIGGLYDYGARFYDPLLGRFVSADTVVPGAGNPQALNRYSYVLNNPLKYTDPTGNWQQTMFDDFYMESLYSKARGYQL
ncbi:MAG: hypothetical protein KJ734_10870 [Chloroflexi bacterium]|nr:hypothetical protein [Chloroflexota bacterium]